MYAPTKRQKKTKEEGSWAHIRNSSGNLNPEAIPRPETVVSGLSHGISLLRLGIVLTNLKMLATLSTIVFAGKWMLGVYYMRGPLEVTSTSCMGS